jgi:hypothetical protein
MSKATQLAVRNVLRGSGEVVTLDELVERLSAGPLKAEKNPRRAIQLAVNQDEACEAVSRGRYVYLPSAADGAAVRINMALASPAQRRLAVDADVRVLLWPDVRFRDSGRKPEIELTGGPSITLDEPTSIMLGFVEVLDLPEPFWDWWKTALSRGANTVILRCLDGEKGRYTMETVDSAPPNEDEPVWRNEPIREAAARLIGKTGALNARELARKLVARRAYQGPEPPDSMRTALFQPPTPFTQDDVDEVSYRPELNPALRAAFAPRLESMQSWSDEVLRDLLGLPAREFDEPEELKQHRAPPVPRALYRLKATLQRRSTVWRVIEVCSDQTFEDLHRALQEAFRWDDDHLYSFYLSGRPHDRVTEVARPYAENEPPLADEVVVGLLDPVVGQRFLYVFDFGDDWRVDLSVEAILPYPKRGKYPRIVERHGRAPEQYPRWGGEDEDELVIYLDDAIVEDKRS